MVITYQGWTERAAQPEHSTRCLAPHLKSALLSQHHVGQRVRVLPPQPRVCKSVKITVSTLRCWDRSDTLTVRHPSLRTPLTGAPYRKGSRF